MALHRGCLIGRWGMELAVNRRFMMLLDNLVKRRFAMTLVHYVRVIVVVASLDWALMLLVVVVLVVMKKVMVVVVVVVVVVLMVV